jgi:prepilin-type N-terminal cleavage/methylation domain-containing protein
LGSSFRTLGEAERSAVAAYVRAEYDKIVFQQPNSYVSQNAQSDPEAWQGRLRELIAADGKRVAAIVDAQSRISDVKISGFTLIELSIVLVIIGLIIGGLLAGQSLIKAPALR